MARCKKPLYIDDSNTMLDLVGHYFSGLSTMKLIVTNDPDEALRLVETGAADLVACEFDLHPCGGLLMFRSVRDRVPKMPFVFVTSKPPSLGLTELLKSERNVRAVYKNLPRGGFLLALRSAFAAAYNHDLKAW